MRGQKGIAPIEVLMTLAILGAIATVAYLGISDYTHSRELAPQTAIYRELTSRPISSLNMTGLQFVVDYAANPPRRLTECRYSVAAMYQNQIIITKLDELLQTEVTP